MARTRKRKELADILTINSAAAQGSKRGITELQRDLRKERP